MFKLSHFSYRTLPLLLGFLFIVTTIGAAGKTSKKEPHNGKALKKTNKSSSRHFELGTPVPVKPPKEELVITLDDPLIKRKWDLQTIEAQKAWLKSKGNKNIVVAVIDTGIDIQHPDLKANIWVNSKEIPGNGKDDDKNGYKDDIHGWNFVHDNNKVQDTHGHGTHIAGIIGAVGGNEIGLSGIAPKVSLMALKYYNPHDDGSSNMKNTIKAIKYAINNGAHIINYSGGGLEGNPDERKAIEEAERKGILFVAAAGNEKSNMDKNKYFPASYALSNILSVTATNRSDHILKSSNWGKNSVHLAAPGINILSTLPGGKYGQMTGTSQATAVATGAAVLIMDYYQIKSARFAIKYLKMTGDNKDNTLIGKTSQGLRLNIFNPLGPIKGKELNFKDQIVHSKCDFPHKGEEVAFCDHDTLFNNEFQIVNRALQSINKKKSKRSKKPNRDPSSERENEIVILKRWLL